MRKHLPKSIHTSKGHIRQEPKNIQSTKQIITPSVIPSVMTAPNPIPEDVGVRANTVFIEILPISGKISSDPTGWFPVTSSRGGKYIMVVADYNSDVILVEPLTSRAKTEILHAVTKLYKHLNEWGLQPRLNRLDNECSALMKKFIREAGTTHQLLSPGLQWALISEREIQTFKCHLIAGLSSCNPKFPLRLWDRLIR